MIIQSANVWNEAGALHNQMALLSIQSVQIHGDENAVLYWSSGLIGICQNPSDNSIVENF